MKTTKRLFSLFLALIMMLSLFPSTALADGPEDAAAEDENPVILSEAKAPEEEASTPAQDDAAAEEPAFLLQPAGGAHPAGGSYLLRWELNRLPDRLELVREEEELDEAGEPEAVLVPEEELDPASTVLEMTAPEEETVWRLRAFFDGDALLSDAFTVTLLPEEDPAAEDEDPAIPGEDPAAAPVVDGTQDDTYYFVTKPYISSFDEELCAFHVLWNTSFAPVKIEVGEKIGEDWSMLATIEPPRYEYYFPAHSGLTKGYVYAYYGTGVSDYICEFFDISMDPVKFLIEPTVGSFDSYNRTFRVTWKTSFTPIKLEVGEKIYSEYVRLETIESGVYQEYVYNFPARDGLTKGYIYAYYGTGVSDYICEFFDISMDPVKFLIEPTVGSFDSYNRTFRVTWKTSFTPVKLEVGEKIHSEYRVLETIESGVHAGYYYDFPAHDGLEFGYIRAYYGTDIGDYIYASVDISMDPVKFLIQPTVGNFDAYDRTFRVSWKTSFTPVKLEVGEKIHSEYRVLETIESGVHAEYYYDFPAHDGLEFGYIRAYYGTDIGDYIYASVDISMDQVKFLIEPADGYIDPDTGYYTAGWKTSFDPVKIEVGEKIGTEYVTLETIESGVHAEYFYDFPANDGLKFGYIRVYYGTDIGDYIYASVDIYPAARLFTSPPAGGTVAPEESLTVNWSTTFVPSKVEFGYLTGENRWIPTASLTASLDRTMSYNLPYDATVNGTMYVRAYYDNNAQWIDSEISVTKQALAFTTTLTDRTIEPETTATLNWITNFTPSRVEIGYMADGNSWIVKDTLTSNLERAMSYTLRYDNAVNGEMRIRAYYGPGTSTPVDGAFTVNKVPRQFTTSPADGSVAYGETLTLSWTTNFTPTRIEFQYQQDGEWQLIRTLLNGLSRSMSYPLPYNNAHETMRLVAYYSAGQAESAEFHITAIPRPWQISFGAGGGSGSMETVTVVQGASFTVPACTFTPPAGKVFSRWGVTGGRYFTPGQVITPTSNMYFVAEWRSENTSVSFDRNGGTGSMNGVSLTPAQAAAWTIPECTYNPPADCVFYKWQIVTAGSSETVYAQPGDVVALSGYNVTLKAIWTLKPYFEVSFSANGHGDAPLPQSVMQDHYASDPGPLSAEGFTFLGWYTDAAGTNRFDFASTKITGPTTLYAKWMDAISAIEISGFRFPEAGASSVPSQLIQTGNSAYVCTGVQWFWTEGSTTCVSYTPVTFQPSTAYYAVITLETVRDYLFDTNADPVSVTINGETVNVDLTRSGYVSETRYQLYTAAVTTEDAIPIDAAHFPDAAFRAVIAGVSCDANRDGYLSRSEIWNITSLNLSNKGIASLEGIGCLSELKTLTAVNNALTSLDLSHNVLLEEVYCSNNPDLAELVLPQNAWLNMLQCYNCSLTGLDVRGCTKLSKAAATTPSLNANGTQATYTYLENGIRVAQMIVDASVTMYDSYQNYARVRFDPGLGSGTMASVMAAKATAYTLPANGFTAPADMYFDGWLLSGSDTVYSAGATMERLFAADENEVVFIAQWKSADVLTITVPDATPKNVVSTSGFAVDLSYTGTGTLPGGKWFTNYSTSSMEENVVADSLLPDTTYYAAIRFPTSASVASIGNQLARGTLVVKNAQVVNVVRYTVGSSQRTFLIVSLQPRTVTVSFQSGGGTGIMAPVTGRIPGSSYTLPACSFTAPADKVFDRWSLGAVGSAITLTEDVTLIARWKVEDGAIPVTEDYFPDETFREYVSETFDTNHGGYLTPAEIAAAQSISMDGFDGLQSVQGIEYFTALTRLELTGNENLTAIDLSANTQLNYLDLEGNGLASLDLTGLSGLTMVYVSDNQLSSLDVGGSPSLRVLCVDGNPLGVLSLGDQPELSRLDCFGTGGSLKTLDIRGCPLLLDVYFNGTRTTENGHDKYTGAPLGGYLQPDTATEVLTPGCISVDPSNFPDPVFLNYVAVNFDTNRTQWLTPAEIAEATQIYLEDANAASLAGIEYLTELEYLTVGDCPALTELKLSANTKLHDIDIYNTGLTALDVSMLPLQYLSCTRSALSSLVLGDQPTLKYLYCYGNNLTELDLTFCPLLVETVEQGTKTEDDTTVTYELGEDGIDGVVKVDANVTLLGVLAPPVITGQPEDATAKISYTASFSVTAEGVGLQYRWQISTDGGETWTELNEEGSGYDTAELSLTVTPDLGGALLRCVVSNAHGVSVTSEAATLTINGGVCGESAYWFIENNTLTIYGSGAMYNYSTAASNRPPWYDRGASITAVVIEDGVTTIGNCSFYGFRYLRSAQIGSGVKTFGASAFYGCSALGALTIPAGATTIMSRVFYNCEALTTLAIPASVTSISTDAFLGCAALTAINVDAASTKYSSVDGVLFNKAKNQLLCYPGGKADAAYTIPDTVKTVVSYSFYQCRALTGVTIPASVTGINSSAFSGCTGLQTITFEGGAPTIGSNAFQTVKATAYYPAEDETWTETVRQNYGGTITWEAYSTKDLSAEVYAGSLSLKGDIGVNLYVYLSEDLAAEAGAYATLNDMTIPIADAQTQSYGGRILATFKLPVPAKEMTDDVILRVFDGEGNPVRLTLHEEDLTETGFVTSVVSLIERQLQTATGKLKTLLQTMSDYGSCAQAQFHYNEESRPALYGDLSTVTVEMLAPYAPTKTLVTGQGVDYAGGSLKADSETIIMHYLKLTGSLTDYEIEVDGAAVTPRAYGSYWIVEIPNIAAKDLDRMYTLTVTKNGAELLRVEYSALSYAYGALSSATQADTLKDLARAMYLYNQAANAYFGA